MNGGKKLSALILMALLACVIFAGCSAKNDQIVGLDETTWDLSGAEPEYLTEWPENAFTEKIARPQSGTVDYVLDYSDSERYAIFVKDISTEESDKYVNELKAAGYSEVHSDGNSVSVGMILERDDAYLSISYSDGVLGVMIVLKENVN